MTFFLSKQVSDRYIFLNLELLSWLVKQTSVSAMMKPSTSLTVARFFQASVFRKVVFAILWRISVAFSMFALSSNTTCENVLLVGTKKLGWRPSLLGWRQCLAALQPCNGWPRTARRRQHTGQGPMWRSSIRVGGGPKLLEKATCAELRESV